jgi:hypothetical protein
MERDVDEVFFDIRGEVEYYGNLLEPETKEWDTNID